MPKKSKNFLDHANERASGLADRIGPQVGSAVGTAREKAGPMIAEARVKAGPMIAEAREKAAPVIAEAREKASPAVHDARDKFTTEVLPVLTAALAAAGEATEDVRGETGRRSKAAIAALKGEVEAPAPKKHRFRKFLLVLGLGGAVAFVARKMSDRSATTTWESTPTPTPAPAPAAPVGAHRAEGEPSGHDQGGSSPDVAAADAAAEPHEATTPDNPAETIDVKKD